MIFFYFTLKKIKTIPHLNKPFNLFDTFNHITYDQGPLLTPNTRFSLVCAEPHSFFDDITYFEIMYKICLSFNLMLRLLFIQAKI